MGNVKPTDSTFGIGDLAEDGFPAKRVGAYKGFVEERDVDDCDEA